MSATLTFPDVFVNASEALNRNEEGSTSQWFTAFRENHQQQLKQLSLPTRKTEDWRYSSRHIKLSDSVAKPLANITTSSINDDLVDLGGYLVIFVNGRFDANQSRLPADEKCTIKCFSELNDTETQQVIDSELSSASSTAFPFVAINNAYLAGGVYISIAKNAQIEKPIQLHFHTEGEGTSTPRVFVIAEQGAEAMVIEEFSGNTATEQLISSVTDIQLKPQSALSYIRLNTESEKIAHVGITRVSQFRDSRFKSYCIGLGGTLRRHDLKIKLLEPGAECSLDGVCVTLEKQHYDNHTEIEHISAHCQSEESYRCIAGGSSHIVFNGRIMIHRDAQKTSGAMSNKNLLLSSKAEIDTKPELEIYADDVKCAHGTTIGQLDAEELYYLTTRGISKDNAATMLTLGFVNELIQKIPNESIKERLEARLESLIQSAFQEV